MVLIVDRIIFILGAIVLLHRFMGILASPDGIQSLWTLIPLVRASFE
jgi:hypothetical protein